VIIQGGLFTIFMHGLLPDKKFSDCSK